VLPDETVFFIDRSLGRRWVAEALARSGLRSEIHDAHFASNAQDVEWLRVVGERGWIVLTKDDRIRRNPPEQRAVLEAGLRVFVIKIKDATGPEIAALVERRASALADFARAHAAPFVALVSHRAIRLVRLRRHGRS
jgi:hypothetical protein